MAVPAVACLALLAGCQATLPHQPVVPPAKPQTRVSYRAVADKHLKHYRIEADETPMAPEPSLHNRQPVYPPALLARHLPPVTVMALLIVDAHGRVREVRIRHKDGEDPVRRQFDAAVRKATLDWRFTPFGIAKWVVEDARGDERRVAVNPKPFSQMYRFRFEIRNGEPVVSGGIPPRHVQR